MATIEHLNPTNELPFYLYSAIIFRRNDDLACLTA